MGHYRLFSFQGVQGDEGNPGEKGDVVSCHTNTVNFTIQHLYS